MSCPEIAGYSQKPRPCDYHSASSGHSPSTWPQEEKQKTCRPGLCYKSLLVHKFKQEWLFGHPPSPTYTVGISGISVVSLAPLNILKLDTCLSTLPRTITLEYSPGTDRPAQAQKAAEEYSLYIHHRELFLFKPTVAGPLGAQTIGSVYKKTNNHTHRIEPGSKH